MRLPPKHLDIFKGVHLRLPTQLSDPFPVRVCSCPLCIYTVYDELFEPGLRVEKAGRHGAGRRRAEYLFLLENQLLNVCYHQSSYGVYLQSE